MARCFRWQFGTCNDNSRQVEPAVPGGWNGGADVRSPAGTPGSTWLAAATRVLTPILIVGLLMGASFAAAAERPHDQNDPYLWLEEVESPEALRWVEEQNAETNARLMASPDYESLYRDALAVLNSKSRIPDVEARGGYLYNFWQDEQHPRGIFRRTTVAELRKDDPRWETVLDVDALAKAEGRPWAMGEVFWREPDETRCLIQLAPAGGDAVEVREFDLTMLRFVESGFVVPFAKSRVAWAGDDAIYVATDFGEGTLTSSGYPRIVKRWRRGTPLSAAEVLHEAPVDSVWVLARRLGTGSDAVHVITEARTFWESTFLLVQERAGKTELVRLAIPATSNVVDAFRGRLVIWLKENWTAPDGQRFGAGAVIAADPAAITGGSGKIECLVGGLDGKARESGEPVGHLGDASSLEPAHRAGLQRGRAVVEAVDVMKDAILVTWLDNVRGRLTRFVPDGAGWRSEPIPFPDHGAIDVLSTDAESGDAWVRYESFVTPPTLYHVPGGAARPEAVKQQAPTFDGVQFQVEQLWCTSADRTRVPYFVVGPKGMKRDGSNPVWMFSYGGFENSLTPSYSGSYEDLKGAYGTLWLERGGVFVLANIRGGGEFGPAWHTSVLKENHTKCFEDFEAVARDLAVRGITSPARLGIEGRSNGGLLVAATMLRHPELYGAVVCGNPLLDMRRYHRLLAGASWMAEYGNPDVPEEWAFIGAYSPYQNVRPGRKLPPILFYTTTRDDRVHPGHARKMAARMEELGYAVDYHENTEGGHHGSVTSEQLARRVALTFAFLWEKTARK